MISTASDEEVVLPVLDPLQRDGNIGIVAAQERAETLAELERLRKLDGI
jgi:hypothetical protein